MYVCLSFALTSSSYDLLQSPQTWRLNIKNSRNCRVLISHSRNKTAVKKAAYLLNTLPYSTSTLTSKAGVPQQEINTTQMFIQSFLKDFPTSLKVVLEGHTYGQMAGQEDTEILSLFFLMRNEKRTKHFLMQQRISVPCFVSWQLYNEVGEHFKCWLQLQLDKNNRHSAWILI